MKRNIDLTFDAIGNYSQDRKLHDTGHIIVKSTFGNLASLSDKIDLYKTGMKDLEMVLPQCGSARDRLGDR
jgi:hypothetical protein